jgi:hypothetical protein
MEAHPGALHAHLELWRLTLGPGVHPLAGKAHPEVPHLEP